MNIKEIEKARLALKHAGAPMDRDQLCSTLIFRLTNDVELLGQRKETISMLEKLNQILNSKGEVVATVAFERESQSWILSVCGAMRFPTEKDAFDYWHENFDTESGQRKN